MVKQLGDLRDYKTYGFNNTHTPILVPDMLGLNEGELIPILVGAIQELTKKLDIVTARIAALESTP